MMKKLLLKKLEEQRKRTEVLLKARKEIINELKEEITGLRQTLDILAAFLDATVSAKGEIRISRNEINRRVKQGYDIKFDSGEIVLQRKE
ncbi:MAG: hypothetical protein IJX50_00235 [Clostridia bacterium]|nr:hypothetical protein [Clostridia bacterium]